MATSAVVSKDTVLKIKIGSTFTKVAELKDFSGLFASAGAIIDATHLESAAKEKLMGLPDEGSPKFTFNYVAADAGQAGLIAARGTQAATDFQLTLAKAGKVASFSAFVLTTEISGGVDKLMEMSAGLEITGAVTLANVAV